MQTKSLGLGVLAVSAALVFSATGCDRDRNGMSLSPFSSSDGGGVTNMQAPSAHGDGGSPEQNSSTETPSTNSTGTGGTGSGVSSPNH